MFVHFLRLFVIQSMIGKIMHIKEGVISRGV